MIKKIETKSNEFWLIDHKQTFENILIGDAVRLTRLKEDNYFFIHNVQLIKNGKIKSFTEPSNSELIFFDYVKRMKEVPNRKLITDDFDVSKYLIK